MNPKRFGCCRAETQAFFAFALAGHLAGKTPAQLADEWIEMQGWDKEPKVGGASEEPSL